MSRALLALLAAAACNDYDYYRDGAPCSSAHTCPPGQACVPNENVCRRPCGHPGNCQAGQPCECQQNNNNNNNGPNNQESCDIDHFCRASCNSPGSPCGGCNGPNCGCNGPNCGQSGFTCDNDFQICRQRCDTQTCPPGTACIEVSGNVCQQNPSQTCHICRPAGCPQAFCNGACVDTGFDASNCGSCGHACTATQRCANGVCSG